MTEENKNKSENKCKNKSAVMSRKAVQNDKTPASSKASVFKGLGHRFLSILRSCSWSMKTTARVAPMPLASLFIISCITGIIPGAQTMMVRSLTDSLIKGNREQAFMWAAVVGVFVSLNMGTTMLMQACNLFIGDRLRAACFSMVNSTIASVNPVELTRNRKAEEARQAREAIHNAAITSQPTAVSSLFSAVVVCIFLTVPIWRISPLAAILVVLSMFPITLAAAIVANVESKIWPSLMKKNRRAEYCENQITYEQQAHELAQLQGRSYVAELANEKRQEFLKGSLYLDFVYMWGIIIACIIDIILIVGAITALISNNAGPAVVSGVLIGVISGMVNMANLGFNLGNMAKDSVSIEAFINFVEGKQPKERQPKEKQPKGKLAAGSAFSARSASPVDSRLTEKSSLESKSLILPQDAYSLRLEDLTVTYEGKKEPAVSGINLEASRGETIALVGRNGAGKTTTLQSMLGLVAVDSGRLLLNGTDISGEDFNQRISHFAVMPQEYNRFEFTIRDSLQLGLERWSVSDKQMWRALQAVEEDGLVSKLPQGLDTQLGAEWGGVGLSGGEWQRLALARMMLRPAAIRILDEPTSNVDSQSEEMIYSTLARDGRDHITILVSHRAWTLQKVDRIYVFREGHIVETGSYRDLSKDGTYFSQLFDYQLNQG